MEQDNDFSIESPQAKIRNQLTPFWTLSSVMADPVKNEIFINSPYFKILIETCEKNKERIKELIKISEMEQKKAFDLVRLITNDELRELAKEIKKIGNAEKPASVKMTSMMAELFAAEASPFIYWLDKYHNVDFAITYEVMYRVREDKF